MRACWIIIAVVFISGCSMVLEPVPKQADIKARIGDTGEQLVITAEGGIENCQTVTFELSAGGTAPYKRTIRGGAAKLETSIPLSEVPLGSVTVTVLCDDDKAAGSIRLVNTRYALINALYAGQDNIAEIAARNETKLKTTEFYQELRTYSLKSWGNYQRSLIVFPYLSPPHKTDHLLRGLNVFGEAKTGAFAVQQLNLLPVDENAEEILGILLRSNDSALASGAFRLIQGTMTGRYFDRFFPAIYNNPLLADELVSAVHAAPDSEFSQKTFMFMKDALGRGVMDPRLEKIAYEYAPYGADCIDICNSLILSTDSKRSALGSRLIMQCSADKAKAEQLRTLWGKYSEALRAYLYDRIRGFYLNDAGFFKEAIAWRIAKLQAALENDALGLQERYIDKDIVSFYLDALEKAPASPAVRTYFMNAPKGLRNAGLKRYLANDFDEQALILFRDEDPAFFEQYLTGKAGTAVGENKEQMIYLLSGFGEKYFDIVYAAYTAENDIGRKREYANALVRAGQKGSDAVIDRIKKDFPEEHWPGLYGVVASKGTTKSLLMLLASLDSFSDDVVTSILMEMRGSKRTVGCKELQERFFRPGPAGIKKQLLYTLVAVCTDGYLAWAEKLPGTKMEEAVFVDAVNNINRLIRLRQDLKKRGLAMLPQYYARMKTPQTRVAIAQILSEHGDKQDRALYTMIMKDAGKPEQKDLDVLLSEYKQRAKAKAKKKQ